MKKIILVLFLIITLASCWTPKEDAVITGEYLIDSYSSEFHDLDLSNRELTMVPNFEKYLTGTYIDDVWSINLSNNKITEIDSSLFEYFPNLKELNLSYNEIEEANIAHNFLQDLKLHKNMLLEVDLAGTSKLNLLNLWYNELKSWDDIKLPKHITTLELQHNSLEDIKWLDKLESLEVLKLEFNVLEDNDMWLLKELKSLEKITVLKNKLSEELEKWFAEFNEKMKKRSE